MLTLLFKLGNTEDAGDKDCAEANSSNAELQLIYSQNKCMSSHAPLVGVQNETATWEDSLAVS